MCDLEMPSVDELEDADVLFADLTDRGASRDAAIAVVLAAFILGRRDVARAAEEARAADIAGALSAAPNGLED